MKRKYKNQGFTLIEVCIAVAILAIALTPFVANFMQASKMNLQSRKDMNAMMLSHDVLEGMSAHTMSEIVENLAVAADAPDSTPEDANNGNTVAVKKMKDYLPIDTGAAVSGRVTGGAVAGKDGLYIYEIGSINTTLYGNGNKNTYDLEIRLDGREQDDDGNIVAGQYVDREYASIESVDSYYDPSFVMPTTEIDSAVAKVKQPGVAEGLYYGKLKRTISINIVNLGTDAAPNYSVTVDRSYQVASASDQATLGNVVETLSSTNIYSNGDTTQPPRNVYLYFDGIENATYSNDLENIEVKNTTGHNVTVFLIRTQTKGSESDSDVRNYNSNFGCTVKVFSKETAELDDGGNPTGNIIGYTFLVSNLRYNLNEDAKKNFRVYKEGSSELLKNIKATTVTAEQKAEHPDWKYLGDSVYNPNRAKYYYDGAFDGSDTTNAVIMNEATYSMLVSDGYKKDLDSKKVYKVTVLVKNVGTDEVVAEYTGGVVD